MLRLILVLIGLLGLSACSHGNLVSDQKDAWIQITGAFSTQLMYCRANADAKGAAVPMCFEPVTLPPRKDLGP